MADMENQVILITGATDGLGKQVALDFASAGAKVLLHGRNPDKGRAVCDEISRAAPSSSISYYNADLSSLQEVRQFAEEVKAQHERLDLLINNAGIGPRSADSERQVSRDGYELFFAINYLAGYLLTRELLPLLQSSKPARIVNVASIGQEALDFNDIMLEQGYDDFRAYRQSKLAQIIFTFDLAARLQGSGVAVNCLHPATLMDTKMVHDSQYFPATMTTVEEGAEALEWLAVSPSQEGVSGEYYEGLDKAQAKPQAYDSAARRQLRELSESLVSKAI